jgi:hypothetical protein
MMLTLMGFLLIVNMRIYKLLVLSGTILVELMVKGMGGSHDGWVNESKGGDAKSVWIAEKIMQRKDDNLPGTCIGRRRMILSFFDG